VILAASDDRPATTMAATTITTSARFDDAIDRPPGKYRSTTGSKIDGATLASCLCMMA
jgi:hypothetical protein